MIPEPPDASGIIHPHIYRDLAPWYPLLTPVGDYAEAAAFYLAQIRAHTRRPLQTMLELGCGAGHNAAWLKRDLRCTLTDLSPQMLALSRRLNPECQHLEGDMRTLRLGRLFDCVFIHDAINHMTTREDLAAALATAYAHTAPGGVALFQPDFVRENFAPCTDTGGSDDGPRGLRYLEWCWDPDPADDTYTTHLAILIREADGAVTAHHDTFQAGLFPRQLWLDLISAAGFEATAVPFEHSQFPECGNEVFVGVRPEVTEGERR